MNSSLQPGRISSAQKETYFVSGAEQYTQSAEIEHRVHLLHLRADERQKMQLDPSYVPAPILEERLTYSLCVSSSSIVKYVRDRVCSPVVITHLPHFLDMLISLKETEFC